MNITCFNCGCKPQEEPYCMVATHCPKCGYIFTNNNGGINMITERKQELLNNMEEYLVNYSNDIDFEEIGASEGAELNEAYDNCLSYIVELVGSGGDKHFFEEVLGFTKEELTAEGMEWIYEKEVINTNLRADGTLEIFCGNSLLAEISDGEQTEEFIEGVLNGMGYTWNEDGTITKGDF